MNGIDCGGRRSALAGVGRCVWMGGRAVECTGLENRQSRKRLVGSNPTPSVWLFRTLPHGSLPGGRVRKGHRLSKMGVRDLVVVRDEERQPLGSRGFLCEDKPQLFPSSSDYRMQGVNFADDVRIQSVPSYRPCMANNSAGTKLGAASIRSARPTIAVSRDVRVATEFSGPPRANRIH